MRAPGKELSELYKSWPQLLKGPAETLWLRKPGERGLITAQPSKWEPQSTRRRQPARKIFVAILKEDSNDCAVTLHILNRLTDLLESLKKHMPCDSGTQETGSGMR